MKKFGSSPSSQQVDLSTKSYNFKKEYKDILSAKILNFTAITTLCQTEVAKNTLLQHCVLKITLENGDLISTDFDEQGFHWKVVQDYCYKKTQDFQPIKQNISLQDVIDCSENLNQNFDFSTNNCYYYINSLINSFTDFKDWILNNWEKKEKSNQKLRMWLLGGGLLLTPLFPIVLAVSYYARSSYKEKTFERQSSKLQEILGQQSQ